LKKPQVLKAERLATDINREISEKGKTLWGLFSGVTRYTTHSVYTTPEKRERSKAMGTSSEIDNLILRILSSDIEELVYDQE